MPPKDSHGGHTLCTRTTCIGSVGTRAMLESTRPFWEAIGAGRVTKPPTLTRAMQDRYISDTP